MLCDRFTSAGKKMAKTKLLLAIPGSLYELASKRLRKSFGHVPDAIQRVTQRLRAPAAADQRESTAAIARV